MVSKEMLTLGSCRSAIRELFEYGKMRKAAVGEENVYDFSLGNPSVPSPEAVNESIKYILDNASSVETHGYTSAVGDNAARQAIADDFNSRYNAGIKFTDLFLTCGAAASLVSVLRALICDSESEILAIAPFFPEYSCFTESNGGKFSFVEADEEHFQIDFDKLEKAVNKNTQAVIINSPNNPSGVIYSRATLEKLAEILKRKSIEYSHPVYIISDEPYRELVYDSTEVPYVPSIYNNTVICYSYSKSLSLPGERIGYVLVPPQADDAGELYNAIVGAARACGFVCAPSLMQKMLIRCAGERPDLASYRKNRDLLYGALTEIGYKCAKPDGAFYLLFEAPNGNAAEFCEIAKKYDLLLVAGDGFRCPRHMRAAYCVDYDMIVRSIPAFRKAFKEATK